MLTWLVLLADVCSSTFSALLALPLAGMLLLPHQRALVWSLTLANASFTGGAATLLDLVGVEAGPQTTVSGQQLAVHHLLQGVGSARLDLVTPSPRALALPSSASLFRNLTWQERELAEMHGLALADTRDSRGVYTHALLAPAPLRRAFPSAGYHELFLCGFTGRLCYRHLSFQG